MKALAVADANGYERFVSQQIYYSLQARDAEHELVPLTIDQGLGSWSGARSPAVCFPASTAAASSLLRAAAT